MLKFSEIFEFSRENSYFERIRTVRMVRMVRSLADRTFQLWLRPRVLRIGLEGPEGARVLAHLHDLADDRFVTRSGLVRKERPGFHFLPELLPMLGLTQLSN